VLPHGAGGSPSSPDSGGVGPSARRLTRRTPCRWAPLRGRRSRRLVHARHRRFLRAGFARASPMKGSSSYLLKVSESLLRGSSRLGRLPPLKDLSPGAVPLVRDSSSKQRNSRPPLPSRSASNSCPRPPFSVLTPQFRIPNPQSPLSPRPTAARSAFPPNLLDTLLATLGSSCFPSPSLRRSISNQQSTICLHPFL